MFGTDFWDKIKNTIKVFHLNFLFNTIGSSYLSKEEIYFLEEEMGKGHLDYKAIPLLDKIFILGQLAQKLGITNINKVDVKDFDTFIKKQDPAKIGIKDSTEELDKIKKQAYLDVLSKQFQIEKETRQSILNEESNSGDGKINLTNVTNDIKEKFEDWSSLDKSISYLSESAFNEGKAVQIKEESNLSDPYVYKVPLDDEKTCKYCKAAYLNSDGSARIFRLSQLQANGTNIGLKPNAWKPVLGQLHLNCRCVLQYLNILKGTTLSDYIWDSGAQRYVLNKEVIKERKVERKSKVHIQIGNKHFDV